MPEQFENNYLTTLSGAIDSAVTTITVANAPLTMTGTFRIKIDDELILVGTATGNVFTGCTRGIEGTTAAAHIDSSPVIHMVTAAVLNSFVSQPPATQAEMEAGVETNLRETSPLRVKQAIAYQAEPLRVAASQVEMEAGTETAIRSMSPLRVKQSVAFNTIISIPFIIDGGGVAIVPGVKGDFEIPFNYTITAWRLFADQSGSIVIDLWADSYANYPPTVADSISTSKPTIASAIKAEDNTISDWNETGAAGRIIRVNVDSCTTITRVTLSLTVVRS